MGDFTALDKSQNKPSKIVVFLSLHKDSEHLHTGFLVRNDEDVIEQIHMKFHIKLVRDAPYTNHKYWWAELGFARDIQTQVLLVGRLEQILNKLNKVPFGLSSNGVKFDPDGTYRYGQSGTGLTCSTFILMVCEELGFTLLQKSTWPENDPKDIKWQEHILRELSKVAPPIYVEAARTFVGCKRYRPAQVATAAAADPPSENGLNHSAVSAKARDVVRGTFGKRVLGNC